MLQVGDAFKNNAHEYTLEYRLCEDSHAAMSLYNHFVKKKKKQNKKKAKTKGKNRSTFRFSCLCHPSNKARGKKAPLTLVSPFYFFLFLWFFPLCLIFSSLPLWARTTKNSDWSTGPIACPFARLLAPFTHLPAPHYLLRSRAPLCSLCSLAHFAHSLAHGTVNDWMTIYSGPEC